MRLFIAVKLPHDQAERASRILPGPLPALRHVQPDLLHLTLAFLGATPDGRVGDVVHAARTAAAGAAPFEVGLAAIGRFPERGSPNVVWLRATRGAAELTVLGERVRRALRERGIAFDDKPFRPHVTLARVRPSASAGDLRALEAALAAAQVPDLRFAAADVHVIESTLSPKGPRYASLEVVPLGRDAREVGEHVGGGRPTGPREGAERPRVPPEALRGPGGGARRVRPDA